jgi:hypothetical protein
MQMLKRVKRFLTFSNMVAVLALFFALGGSVYAATGKISGAQIKPKSIPGNRIKPKTITGQQIQPGSISSAQLKSGSISSSQIQAGSITGTQIKAGSLTGTQVIGSSLTGVSAAAIGSVQYVSVSVPLDPEKESGTSGAATCPPGMKVIGGGATVSNPTFAYVNESAPSADRNGWFANSYAGALGVSETITAICTAVTAPQG